MSTSIVNQARLDGTPLSAIISLRTLGSVSENQLAVLDKLQIRTIADLLNYTPIHHARIVMQIARGEIAHEVDLKDYLDASASKRPLTELGSLSVELLVHLVEAQAKILENAFGVKTIEALAEFPPFVEANTLLGRNAFFEAPSAPDALLPKLIGSTHTAVRFNSFVRASKIFLKDTPLAYLPEVNVEESATLVGSLFTRPSFKAYLGYVTGYKQSWINRGTHLGEVLHSLALAPGESRNIAIIEWYRKQSSARAEDTLVDERLTNELVHTRALDEVTRTTATEHQNGNTEITSSTSTTGGSLTGGTGNANAASIGAEASLPIDGVDLALSAARTMSQTGSIGGSLVFSNSEQQGTVTTETDSTRKIQAEVQQNIAESTVQNASRVRSLRSSVVVTDEQAERESVATRNVTNYNHMHAVTVQYYEVLQKYDTVTQVDSAKPLLFLPFKPIEFDIETIKQHWEILKIAVRAQSEKLFQEFNNVIEGYTRFAREFDRSGTLKVTRLVLSASATGTSLGTELFIEDANGNTIVSMDLQQSPRTFTRFLGGDSIDIDELKVLRLQTVFLSTAALRVDLEVTLEDQVRNSITVLVEIGPVAVTSPTSRVLEANLNSKITETARGLENLLPSQAIELVEGHFKRRKFGFTRFFLNAIENEHLTSEIERLFIDFQDADVSLSDVVDPSPIAITENHLMFQLRPRLAVEVADRTKFSVVDGFIEILDSSTHGSPAKLKNLAGGGEILSFVEGSQTSQRLTILLAPSGLIVSPQGAMLFDLRLRASEATGQITLRQADSFGAPEVFEFSGKALDAGGEEIGFTGSISPIGEPGRTLQLTAKLPIKTRSRAGEATGDFEDLLSDFVASTADKENFPPPSRETVFLPTSGVFAEAILGRSNAAEKIDITRFFNWQDSPIPHLAPLINGVATGSRAQAIPDLNATVNEGGVLNVTQPAAFPGPSTAAGALAALQNGELFRDVSGAAQLGEALGNLADLASETAQLSGTLAGEAREQALQAALDLGKEVTKLVGDLASSDPIEAPKSLTEAGARQNAGLSTVINIDSTTASGASADSSSDSSADSSSGSGSVSTSDSDSTVVTGNENNPPGGGDAADKITATVKFSAAAPSEVWELDTQLDFESNGKIDFEKILDFLKEKITTDLVKEAIKELLFPDALEPIADVFDKIREYVSSGDDSDDTKRNKINSLLNEAEILREIGLAMIRFKGGTLAEATFRVTLDTKTATVDKIELSAPPGFKESGLFPSSQTKDVGDGHEDWFEEKKVDGQPPILGTGKTLPAVKGGRTFFSVKRQAETSVLIRLEEAKPYFPYETEGVGLDTDFTIGISPAGIGIDASVSVDDIVKVLAEFARIPGIVGNFELKFVRVGKDLRCAVEVSHNNFPDFEITIDPGSGPVSLYSHHAELNGGVTNPILSLGESDELRSGTFGNVVLKTNLS